MQVVAPALRIAAAIVLTAHGASATQAVVTFGKAFADLTIFFTDEFFGYTELYLNSGILPDQAHYQFAIHEASATQDCGRAGGVFNPTRVSGAPNALDLSSFAVGDITGKFGPVIKYYSMGVRADARMKLSGPDSIIGRAVVVRVGRTILACANIRPLEKSIAPPLMPINVAEKQLFPCCSGYEWCTQRLRCIPSNTLLAKMRLCPGQYQCNLDDDMCRPDMITGYRAQTQPDYSQSYQVSNGVGVRDTPLTSGSGSSRPSSAPAPAHNYGNGVNPADSPLTSGSGSSRPSSAPAPANNYGDNVNPADTPMTSGSGSSRPSSPASAPAPAQNYGNGVNPADTPMTSGSGASRPAPQPPAKLDFVSRKNNPAQYGESVDYGKSTPSTATGASPSPATLGSTSIHAGTGSTPTSGAGGSSPSPAGSPVPAPKSPSPSRAPTPNVPGSVHTTSASTKVDASHVFAIVSALIVICLLQ